METRLSTDTVKPSDRIAYWRDAICRCLRAPRARLRSSAAVLLRADDSQHRQFDLIYVAGSPQRVDRSARHVEADPSDSLIIMLQKRRRGPRRQGDIDARMAPGSLTLLDSRRPIR